MIMNSVDGHLLVKVLLSVFGVIWFNVQGVPVLNEYDIWGDGNFVGVNGSGDVRMGNGRNAKGKCV